MCWPGTWIIAIATWKPPSNVTKVLWPCIVENTWKQGPTVRVFQPSAPRLHQTKYALLVSVCSPKLFRLTNTNFCSSLLFGSSCQLAGSLLSYQWVSGSVSCSSTERHQLHTQQSMSEIIVSPQLRINIVYAQFAMREYTELPCKAYNLHYTFNTKLFLKAYLNSIFCNPPEAVADHWL